MGLNPVIEEIKQIKGVVTVGEDPTQLSLLFVIKQGRAIIWLLFSFGLLIWNELQSRNGGHTCDPDLEAGKPKHMIQSLRNSGLKKFGTGLVAYAFNPRIQRQADL